MDYVDRVDEQTLCVSFEKFMELIDFEILGVISTVISSYCEIVASIPDQQERARIFD